MPDLVTVRIPELLEQTDPLTLADQIPVWISSLNKTRHATLQSLATLINTGGGGEVIKPVTNGATIIYIVPDDIGSNVQTASIPEAAGKSFKLRRGGMPLLVRDPDNPTVNDEFSILNAGGFTLLQSEDYLVPGERFELDFYEYQSPSVITGAASSLITGAVQLTTNTNLGTGFDTTYKNKLLQIRADAIAITVTLPDVSTVANQILCFETCITNTLQSKIVTTGGQNIYMNGSAWSALYMGIGESLWLYAGSDGWYVMNDFGMLYGSLAEPKASYQVKANQLVCKGQLVARSAYPRLWEYIQGLGASLVSDATWNTASAVVGGRTVQKPYRGCFSSGDGSTTFRVPDLMGMTLKGLLNDGGSDPDRSYNHAGGYQDDQVGMGGVDIKLRNGSGGSSTNPLDGGNSGLSGFSGMDGAGPLIDNVQGGNDYWLTFSGKVGNDTRVENVGVLWVINV